MSHLRTPLRAALGGPASLADRDDGHSSTSPRFFGPTYLEFGASMEDLRLGPAFENQHAPLERLDSDTNHPATAANGELALQRLGSSSPDMRAAINQQTFSDYFAAELCAPEISLGRVSRNSSSLASLPLSTTSDKAAGEEHPTRQKVTATDRSPTALSAKPASLASVLGPPKIAELDFYDVREGGHCVQREATRIEILNEARSGMVQLPNAKRIGGWLVSSDSVKPDFEAFKQEVGWTVPLTDHPSISTKQNRDNVLRSLLKSALKLRDIRQVDPRFHAKSSIWVRSSAIVVAIENIRALICHDRAFLFNPGSKDADACRQVLCKHLSAGQNAEVSSEDQKAPFELLALEGVLIAVVMGLETDFLSLEPTLSSRIQEISQYLSSSHLETLRIQQQKLNHFRTRAEKVKEALQEILEDDEDMSRMYLTERRQANFIFRNPLDHDEVEALLEAYLQVVSDLSAKAKELDGSIDDLVDLVGIHLDSLRNKLLMVQMSLAITGLMLTLGSMVAGVFGMNMVLPIFDAPSSGRWFAVVFFSVVLGVPGGSVAAHLYLRRRGMYIAL